MRFHASGRGAFLPDSFPCAISRRRGIPSFRGRSHSPSPAVHVPSAGDVASPPFGGEVLAQASLHLQSSPHLQRFRIRTASLGHKLNSVPYRPPRLLSSSRILPSPSRSTVVPLVALGHICASVDGATHARRRARRLAYIISVRDGPGGSLVSYSSGSASAKRLARQLPHR